MSDDNGDQGPSTSGGGDSQNQSTGPPPQQQDLNWTRFMEIVHSRKVDVALWATRFLTIVFATFYMIPIMGYPNNYYYKALLASAATSALRLHQRLPNVSLSRAFLTQLLMEDSCHYLFYSLIFVYSPPIGLAMTPITLFAVLHFASFSLTLLDALNRNFGWIWRLFISLVDYHTVTILRLAAGSEIVLQVITITYMFGAKGSFVTPFMYYRFLTLRYASRRNHYTRTMFYELRMGAERFIMSGKCPQFLQKMLRWNIDFLCKIAPQPAPTPTN